MNKTIHTTKMTWEFCYWLIGISLFFLPLINAWMVYPLGVEGFYTTYSALGGILPWSDANSYYSGANTLLENGVLDFWNMRRSLNASLFSMRLWLSNNNFYIALIIQALLCGISCLLVTKSINKVFGTFSSIITLLVLLLFASLFIPTTMSETLGLTIGCLSFVVLWEAIIVKNNWLFFIAGLMLTIGLNVRAGAFFILPILILWLGYSCRKNQKAFQFNWIVCLVFSFGIIGGFIYNLILIKLYSAGSDGALHANFSHTLFGLVSGGKTWSYIYSIQPEFAFKSEDEQAKYLYIQSWEVFKNNPFLLLKGFIRGYLGVIQGLVTFFQYWLVISNNVMLKIIVRFFGFVALFFGVFRLYSINNLYENYDQNHEIKNKIQLINISLIGIFLSAGVIWTDGGVRVFAVTVPFFAVACGIIIGYRLFPRLYAVLTTRTNNSNINWEANIAIGLSGVLLIFGLFGPMLMKSSNINVTQMMSRFSCQLDSSKMVVKNIAGSPKIELPKYSKRFKSHLLKNPIESESFLKILQSNLLTQPMFLGSVYDLNINSTKYILGAKEIFSNNATCMGLCVTNIPDIQDIMQVTSFEVLDEK